jgi:2-hydroxymuconate-semialdehyde hydrolase
MTNYHDAGQGDPVLLIHGSGPGVTGWANWRLTIPELAARHRVLAPDMVGFGYTERPAGLVYGLDAWVFHALDFLDALGLDQVDLVGNSFGGALSLALAIRHPERVRRLVLMGAVGIHFELTPALDAVWGYTPSVENMRNMMDTFAFNRALINDDLARMRFEASIRPGVQEAYRAMFPAPRQRWIEALASDENSIAALTHETLIVHGRDDQVIPLSNSLRYLELIENSQLHVFARCGHWTQIEHAGRFARLVLDFLGEESD